MWIVKSEVFNLDCMDFMRGLPDNAFDLAIADPPPPRRPTHYVFGLRKKNGGYANRRNLGDEVRKKIISWDTAPSQEFFQELFRVSRNSIIWGGNYFTLPPTRCFCVWRKLTISEEFSMAMAEYAWTSFSGNAKVFEAPPQGDKNRFHPTQKPVALYAWLLRRFARPGDKIFDPMMGSQSSRIACHAMGFDFTGCERDADYFARGCARFDRECRGEVDMSGGKKGVQGSLF